MNKNTLHISHFSAPALKAKLFAYLKEDAAYWWLLAVMCSAYAVICFHAVSVFGWHASYFKWVIVLLFSPGILLVKWLNEKCHSKLYILEAFAKFSLAFDIAYYMTIILLTTKHHFVDHTLLRIDDGMHFHLLNLVNFAGDHPWFYKAMAFCYRGLDNAFLLLVFVLALLNEKKEVNRLIFLMLTGVAIAGIAFYFFPAFGPGLILHSHFIPPYGPILTAQYHQIQYNLPLNMHHYFAGFVSVPSIHCYAAMLSIYMIFRNKQLRWLLAPLTLFNIGIIASTLFLGEHYLIDVIAALGMLLTTVSLYNLALRYVTMGKPKNHALVTRTLDVATLPLLRRQHNAH